MLRIGIVGTGIIAHEHAKAIAQLRDRMSVVAAADVAAERLAAFCATYDIARGCATADELIRLPNIDLVAIATPPSAHEAVATAALDAGKYVLCEKPLGATLASALRIAEAEKRHPGKLAVGYQMRYDDAWQRAIWLARNGWLGGIESVSIERHGQIPHTDGGGAWWGRWEVSGGGVLITQVIHELDLLIAAAGMPKAVSARMDTHYTGIESDDHAELTMRLSGGGVARCIASVNSPRRGGGIAIRGSHAEIALPWKLTSKDPSIAANAIAAVDAVLPETRGPSRSLAARGTRFARRRLGIVEPAPLSPHARFYREIASAIASGRPLPIPPAEGLKSLQLVAAAYESALSNAEVALPVDPASTAARGITIADWNSRQCPRFEKKPIIAIGPSRDCVRVAFVGVDTSHAPTFAKILHDANDPFHIPGARVVAAFPGGSPDMDISRSRVGGFTAELRDRHRVQIVDSPEDAADLADVVFILASDGRLHPALFDAVAGRGKPVFIDKPFAVSTEDAKAMIATAERTGTRFLACSAFRYADGLVAALDDVKKSGERITGCTIRFWLQIQPTQGRYFWYGIHAAEMLVAALGPGVADVEAKGDAHSDAIVVRHRNGIESKLIGARHDGTFAVSLTTDRRTIDVPLASSNASLPSRVLWSALDVLVDGRYPRLWSATTAGSVAGARPGRIVDPTPEETVEVIHLLDAAQKSRAAGGKIAVDQKGQRSVAI